MRAATETIWRKYTTWRNFSCMSHRKSMEDPGRTRPNAGLAAAMSWDGQRAQGVQLGSEGASLHVRGPHTHPLDSPCDPPAAPGETEALKARPAAKLHYPPPHPGPVIPQVWFLELMHRWGVLACICSSPHLCMSLTYLLIYLGSKGPADPVHPAEGKPADPCSRQVSVSGVPQVFLVTL